MTTLLVDSDVPSHVRREHILTGYRPLLREDQSLLRAFLSGLFTVHNETLNVWSHMLGVVWAAERLHWLVHVPPESLAPAAPVGMRTSVGVFLVTALFCLGSSVAAHLYAPIVSREPSNALWRLDSYGICLLIAGSYLPGMTFGFRCLPGWRFFYLSLVFVLLLVGAWGSATAEAGRKNLAETLRVGSLSASVAFGLVPVTHFCCVAPSDELSVFLAPALLMLALYAGGFCFYASAMPERLRPGQFDYRGGSHLMWHLGVLGAVASWEHGARQMLLHRDASVCEGWAVG